LRKEKAEGKAEGRAETLRNMLLVGLDIETILKVGFQLEEIENMQKQLKTEKVEA